MFHCKCAFIVLKVFHLLHRNSIWSPYRRNIDSLKLSFSSIHTCEMRFVKIASVFIDSLQPLKCDVIIFGLHARVSIDIEATRIRINIRNSVNLIIYSYEKYCASYFATYWNILFRICDVTTQMEDAMQTCKHTTYCLFVVKPFARALPTDAMELQTKILIKWRNIYNSERYV